MAFVVGQPTATEPNATPAIKRRRIDYRRAVTNGVLLPLQTRVGCVVGRTTLRKLLAVEFGFVFFRCARSGPIRRATRAIERLRVFKVQKKITSIDVVDVAHSSSGFAGAVLLEYVNGRILRNILTTARP